MCVNRIDHQVQQSFGLCFKLHFRHSRSPFCFSTHSIRVLTKSIIYLSTGKSIPFSVNFSSQNHCLSSAILTFFTIILKCQANGPFYLSFLTFVTLQKEKSGFIIPYLAYNFTFYHYSHHYPSSSTYLTARTPSKGLLTLTFPLILYKKSVIHVSQSLFSDFFECHYPKVRIHIYIPPSP